MLAIPLLLGLVPICTAYVVSTRELSRDPLDQDVSVKWNESDVSVLAPRNGNGISIPVKPHKFGHAQVNSYQAEMTVGPLVDSKPGSNVFNLNIDTGSWALYILSDLMPATMLPNHKTRYHFRGEICKPTGFQYGDGTVVATQRDTGSVSMAGVKGGNPATATTNPYWIWAVQNALRYPAGDQDGNADGTMGFGPFPNTWFKRSDITPKTFTTNFNLDGDSTLVLGETDSSLISGKVEWVDVSYPNPNAPFWLVPSGNYGSTLLDTGSTGIMLDDRIVQGFFKAIKERLGIPSSSLGDPNNPTTLSWYLPCDAKLPALKVQFNGQTFEIPGSYLIGQADPNNDQVCFCLLKVTNMPFTILGLPFFHANNVIFDQDNNRIGFTKKPSVATS